jgi:HEAT repeat protein
VEDGASSSLRDHAARALGNIGPDAEEAIPALVRALGNEPTGEEFWVGVALGKIGIAALPAWVEITL